MPFNLFSGDPQSQAMLALTAGLLESGGPSRMPVGVGQGIARGMMGGREAYMAALEAKRRQEMVDLTREEMLRRAGQPISAPPGSQMFMPGATSPFHTVPFKPEPVGTPVAPTTRKIRIGNQEVTQEWNGSEWKEVGRGAAFSDRPPMELKVENKLGEGLAGKVGEIAAEGRSAASGAVGIVDTVTRVKDAIEKGNVNLGPGATIRTKADQVAQFMGIGGETTTERLVNTRNTIRGLAQFTVNARKALKGQGQVSDYEGKLLTKAESGDIDDFTLPELKDFLRVTERLARQAHSEHKRILGVMGGSDNEAVRGLVPYFDVPDLPNAPSAKPRRYNPKTGKIE